MPIVMHVESTLTDRYQTTVPESVRRQLGLSKRDKIQYDVMSDGMVVLRRAQPSPVEDPVLDKFLSFLAQDMTNNPQHLQMLDPALIQRVAELVGDAHVDLDQALSEDDE
ncbi:type II toxin-antitoxin system PrlF family antitoxin [Limnohabitans sp.]|uniref:type II toxin-antitoxin system PrlF family antitoxin n=1 Tax=Limnohabitans sp. TaxID=1907725 RepID=UPI00286F6AA3|nr:type II toxin-antitoxin system PrlF family antitoxin [Limnohabitans sp.]